MTAQFPTLGTWTEYAEAVQRHSDLTRDLKAAQEAFNTVQRQESTAKQADQEARGAAIRLGEKDPGSPHLKKWKADKEAAEGKVDALTAAVRQQEAEVHRLLRAEPERAAQAAQEAAETARQAYDAALAGVLAARDRFWASQRVEGWVTEGFRQGRPYRPSGAPAVLFDPRPISNPWQERTEVQAVRALDGFRAEIAPEPEPSEIVGYRIRRTEDVRGYDDMTTGRRSAVDSVTYTPVPVDANGREVLPR